MYATINGARIFFDVEGEGHLTPRGSEMAERPVLFLLHGGPGHDHSYFKPWMTPLASAFQLVYVDHRGNGRSERTSNDTYTHEQMADDIDGLRMHLGLDTVSVLGHSFGGMLALTHAVRYQHTLDKLIIASSTACKAESLAEAMKNAEATATDEQKAIVRNLYEGRITTQEEFEQWWRVCLPMFYFAPDHEAVVRELDRTILAFEVSQHMARHESPRYDLRPALGTIEVPTLVIGGRHDWVTPPSQSVVIADGIPGAELVIQEEVAHFGFVENQAEFLGAVEEFLGR